MAESPICITRHVLVVVEVTVITFNTKQFFYFKFSVGTFQMRSSPGDDVIHRTIDTALKFGYRLIGEICEGICFRDVIANQFWGWHMGWDSHIFGF